MMFRETVILTIVVFVFCANTLQAEEVDKKKIKAARFSTVLINGDKVNTNPGIGNRDASISFNGVGAGVIVDSGGFIITNYHVIEGINKILVKTYDQQEYIGQYISHDPTTDIALIRITPLKTVEPISIGDSSVIDILDHIIVTGHPFGYDYTTSSGEISGLCREVPVKNDLKYFNLIQISAAINPGNSGGPLLNTQGEMIGLNSALRQDANLIAFAIPVDFVMEVGADLFHQYTSQYCYHGVRFKEIDVNLIGTPQINVSDYKVLAIASVDPDSPADEAGLSPGDVLVEANNLHLNRKLDFQRSLIDKKEGDAIHLVFDRNGTQYQADMVLRSSPSKTRVTGRAGITGAANKSMGQNQPANQAIASRPTATPFNVSREMMNSDLVWNTFGIRVTPVSQEDFQRKTPGMESPYVFEGAVEVTDVRPGGLFASLKIVKGDMLAAIITPKDPWNITRVSDLKYLAERWTSEEMGGNEVKIIIVRNQRLFEGNLPVPQNNLANTSQNLRVAR